MSYLRGQQLFGFVDGSVTPPPSSFLPPVEGVSFTQPVIHTMVSEISNHPKFAGILSVRRCPDSNRRPLHISKAKNLSDTLAAIGKPMEDCEIVSYLLAAYDPLITSITTRVDPMTLDDIFSHLLNYEMRLEQQTSAVDMTVAYANIATSCVSQSNNRNNGNRGRYLSYCSSRQYGAPAPNRVGKGVQTRPHAPPEHRRVRSVSATRTGRSHALPRSRGRTHAPHAPEEAPQWGGARHLDAVLQSYGGAGSEAVRKDNLKTLDYPPVGWKGRLLSPAHLDESKPTWMSPSPVAKPKPDWSSYGVSM
ncbi:hypothetical protein Acr_00g0018360 [Actinidia rufa]|uniref:Uncharacterized protein n=1 Tax=Actinidia rufa TaxID=165716 RepID=A0A7J0DBF2_9ERIC|nr:hypothetical protein Acr_00g0018360 [Actinidia rufa]